MRRTFTSILLILACGLAHAGCRWSYSGANSGGGTGGVGSAAGGVSIGGGGGDGADALVKQLNSFTDELLAKVERAEDAKTGVTEAQALLNARTKELAGAVAAIKQGAPVAGSKAKLLEAEVENTDRVHRLQLKYSDDAARDPDLKARLERLINDYDALFR